MCWCEAVELELAMVDMMLARQPQLLLSSFSMWSLQPCGTMSVRKLVMFPRTSHLRC